VWRGTDEVLGRTVAVKILLPALLEEPGFAERFRGEARTMASINHPGVVDVYDYGSDDAVAYLIMEYVEGDALSRTLSRVGRLTPARTMALVAQAADALQAAHEKGIVHRDVKPGNLLVRPNGTLVLTDFGIARSALVGQLTVAGSVLGTASYISPEQAAGAVATPASDVYALGVVAYQCLAGRRPFEGDNPLELAMKHVRDAPPPLPGDIPPAVRTIVERAMAKDPPARWPSAAQLAAVARQAAVTLGNSQSGPIAASAGLRSGSVPVRSAGVATPSNGQRPGSPATPAAGRPPSSPAPVQSPVPVAHPASPSPSATRGGAPALMNGNRVPQAYPAPGSPAPAGPGYVRGAASVAPSVQRPPVQQPYGYGSKPAPTKRSSGGRTGVVILLAVLAALLIVVCSGVVAYLIKQTRNASGTYGSGQHSVSRDTGTGSNGQAPAAGSGAGNQAASNIQDIPCEYYKRDKYQNVRNELEASGFRVSVVPVAGGQAGRVIDVSPCRAGPAATITLRVATGKITAPETN
jgi:serine/threonine-protein kinase